MFCKHGCNNNKKLSKFFLIDRILRCRKLMPLFWFTLLVHFFTYLETLIFNIVFNFYFFIEFYFFELHKIKYTPRLKKRNKERVHLSTNILTLSMSFWQLILNTLCFSSFRAKTVPSLHQTNLHMLVSLRSFLACHKSADV